MISGYAFKSAEFGEEGVPVIKIKNIRVGTVDLSDAARVDERFLRLDPKYHVKSGDLLISLTGSHMTQPNSVVGRVARMGYNPTSCLLNQRAGKIFLRNQNDADLTYLFYILSSPQYGQKIAVMASGAANQANVSPTQVESLEIPIPDLPTQLRIAGILSAYDNLIANNLRRIRILEEMAQSLYREWFVHFRFPGSAPTIHYDDALPLDWGIKSIMESAYCCFVNENIRSFEGAKSYFATADLEGLELASESPRYSFADKPSRAQKEPIANSVWFARMQETYKVLLCVWANSKRWENAMLSSGFAGFEAVDPDFLPFVFCTINTPDFHSLKDQYCTGATQRSLTNTGLNGITIIEPPMDLVRRFGRIVNPFLDELAVLQLRNQILRQTRDLLLPKLLTSP